MSVSEAQKKASIKYLEKLDEIRIRMPKGKKDDIKAAASTAGESMNQYIVSAIDQRMERDEQRCWRTPSGNILKQSEVRAR